MAQRRYGFRCSFAEGCFLVFSLLLTSSFVFLFGVYVGKAGEARKGTQPTEIVRLPLSGSQAPSSRLQSQKTVSQPTVPLPVSVPVEKSSSRSLAKARTLAEMIEEEPAPAKAPTLAEMIEEEPDLPLPQPKVEAKPVPPPPPPKVEKKVEAKVKPAPQPSREDAPAEKPARKPAPPPPAPKVKAEAKPKPVAPPKVVASVKPAPAVQTPPSPATTASTRRAKPVASTSGRWSVQVQETTQQGTVQETAKLLRAQGYTPIVIKAMKSGEIVYRVRIGKFRRQEDAVAAIADIRRGGKFGRAYVVSE